VSSSRSSSTPFSSSSSFSRRRRSDSDSSASLLAASRAAVAVTDDVVVASGLTVDTLVFSLEVDFFVGAFLVVAFSFLIAAACHVPQRGSSYGVSADARKQGRSQKVLVIVMVCVSVCVCVCARARALREKRSQRRFKGAHRFGLDWLIRLRRRGSLKRDVEPYKCKEMDITKWTSSL
jgi:hypothetical protein